MDPDRRRKTHLAAVFLSVTLQINVHHWAGNNFRTGVPFELFAPLINETVKSLLTGHMNHKQARP